MAEMRSGRPVAASQRPTVGDKAIVTLSRSSVEPFLKSSSRRDLREKAYKAFTARGDNGNTQPNYSHLLGSLAAASISNLYHPADSRSVGDTFQTFGIDLAGNIVGNIFREFLLRHLEKVPAFANGKH